MLIDSANRDTPVFPSFVFEGPGPSLIVRSTGYLPSVIHRAPPRSPFCAAGRPPSSNAVFKNKTTPLTPGRANAKPDRTPITSPKGRPTSRAASVNNTARGRHAGAKETVSAASQKTIEISGLMRACRARRRRGDRVGDDTSDVTTLSSVTSDDSDLEILIDGDTSDDSTDDTILSSSAVLQSTTSTDSRRGRKKQGKKRPRRCARDAGVAPTSGVTDDDATSLCSSVQSRGGTGRKSRSQKCSSMERSNADIAMFDDPAASSIRLLKPLRSSVRLTVVLDLDETLIRFREGHPYVRPHARALFETLSSIAGIETIIWTCATERYARRALQYIPNAVWNHIIARDARWYADPAVKNLQWLARDLERCIMFDNSPVAVSANTDNCVVVQDIPPCLPTIDETLLYVARCITDVIASGRSVSDALNKSPYVCTAAFQIEEEGDDSSLGALDYGQQESDVTPVTPTSSSNAPQEHTNARTSPPRFPSDDPCPPKNGQKQAAANMVVARTLKYSIPSVLATYGSIETPPHRLPALRPSEVPSP